MKIGRLLVAMLLLLSLSACEILGNGLESDSPSTWVNGVSVRENTLLKTLHFSLSDSDIKDSKIKNFRDCVDRCEEIYYNEKKTSPKELKNALYEMKAALDWFDRQRDIANYLYMYDTTDITAKENYTYAEQIYTQIRGEYWSCIGGILNTAKARLPIVKRFVDEEHGPLLTVYFDNDDCYLRERELYAEFCSYNFKGTAEQIHGIFTEYLRVSRTYAQSYGCDDFYEYTTRHQLYRDYGKEEREQFREYVKRYLIPLYLEYHARSDAMYNSLGFLQRRKSDAYYNLPFDQFDQNYLFLYFDSLPDSIGNTMRSALEQGHVIIGDQPGSQKKASFMFCGDDPVCYFHESCLDLISVSHELGHYYKNTIHGVNANISYDMSEVHSQANSLLMLRYLRDVIDSRAYDSFEVYEIENILYQTILATVRDEFDERIYSDPDAHTYTADELTAIMENLIQEYGIDKIGGSLERHLKTYWHRQGMNSPAYNLSYATSAVIALQIYYMSETDYAAATECYRLLIEEIDFTSTFLGTLEDAGLYSPFDEQLYLDLATK